MNSSLLQTTLCTRSPQSASPVLDQASYRSPHSPHVLPEHPLLALILLHFLSLALLTVLRPAEYRDMQCSDLRLTPPHTPFLYPPQEKSGEFDQKGQWLWKSQWKRTRNPS